MWMVCVIELCAIELCGSTASALHLIQSMKTRSQLIQPMKARKLNITYSGDFVNQFLLNIKERIFA